MRALCKQCGVTSCSPEFGRPDPLPLAPKVEAGRLVRHFVQHLHAGWAARSTPSPPTMEVLVRYPWPGNIRELQNLIEHSVILSSGPVLHIPLGGLQSRGVVVPDGPTHRTLEEAEREHILATLKETKWVISGPNGAATRLGMNRCTLQFRMKKLGILRSREMMSRATLPSDSDRSVN